MIGLFSGLLPVANRRLLSRIRMKLVVFAICRFVLLMGCAGSCLSTSGAEEKPVKRAGAPKDLLEERAHWQVQSGDWKVSPDGASATAGDTLAELTASRATRLAGRWLSFKVAITGENAKAGLWIGGVRDTRGEILRLSIEAATGKLTNGRGKAHAPLGDIQPSVELLLRFDAEKLSVFRAGNSVAELPIT